MFFNTLFSAPEPPLPCLPRPHSFQAGLRLEGGDDALGLSGRHAQDFAQADSRQLEVFLQRRSRILGPKSLLLCSPNLESPPRDRILGLRNLHLDLCHLSLTRDRDSHRLVRLLGLGLHRLHRRFALLFAHFLVYIIPPPVVRRSFAARHSEGE